jgi:hypothetical protein
VTAPTIQPGTRCGCRVETCEHGHAGLVTGPVCRCSHDAVRMVTVRDMDGNVHPPCVAVTGSDMVTGIVGIPMCEPCAAYHESKAGTR